MGTAAPAKKTKPGVNGVPPAAVDVVQPGEVGIDGIGNFSGLIYAEQNPKLLYNLAYGRAGTRQWGEWETIVRTDEAVAKALDFVVAPIRDARVDIEPADESALAKQQADFIRECLLEGLEPGWPEFLQQTVRGSLGAGFSLHELVWDGHESEFLPGGRGHVVRRLAERLPSSLHQNAWLENDAGELITIRQLGPRGGKFETVDLPVEKVLLNSWNRNGNNYAGYSAFRAVWYACKIREQLLKLTGIALVREAAGIPTAYTTDPKAKLSANQRDEFEKLLRNLVYHENASVVCPSGWRMEWVYSPAANKGHVVEVFNQLGLLILTQLGAQQLYLGTHNTGSRSVGEVHAAQAEIVVNGVVANLELVLNGVRGRAYNGLIRKLIEANWPGTARYPRLKLTLKRARLSPKERMEAIKTAKDAGFLTVTAADENAVREDLGLSPIDEAEREQLKQKALEQMKALPPPAPFGGKPTSGEPPAAKASLRASDAPFQPRRELRASERHLDLQAMSAALDAGPDEFVHGVRPLVAEMLMRALPAVKLAMQADPASVGDIKLDTTRLDAFVAKYLGGLAAAGYAEVRKEMIRQQAKPLAAAAEEDDLHEPDASEPEVLVSTRKHLVRRMAQRLTSDLEKEAIDVDRTGGDPEEVVTRALERQASSGAFRQDASLVTTKAFNVGRQEFADEYGSEIESTELSAVMDKNTCGPCDRLDGTEFDFGSDDDIEHTPPLSSICDGGDACRCIKIFNFAQPEDDA